MLIVYNLSSVPKAKEELVRMNVEKPFFLLHFYGYRKRTNLLQFGNENKIGSI